jgi:DNA invertase Pin-like site-specific DNA recombinase
MSAPAFAYVRLPSPHSPALPGEAEQSKVIERYSDQHGLQVAEVFMDTAEAAGIAWLDRPAGMQLARRLTPGSQVVVAAGFVIFTSIADLLEAVRELQRREVTLHVASVKAHPHQPVSSLSTAGTTGVLLENTLAAVLAMKRSSRSEAVTMGMQQRKAEGVRYCHFAGYGHKWEGRRGQERRVPDTYEQEVITKIVEWKKTGYSWYQIAAILLRHRISTSGGREWSVSRVRRACMAELARRAALPTDNTDV